MRAFLKLALVMAFGAAPLAASADVYCSGLVHNVYVDSSGNLLFSSSWRQDYTQVCSVTVVWNNISPATCSTWFALLSSADQKQEQVLVDYVTANYTCANLPTYGSAISPYYVMLQM